LVNDKNEFYQKVIKASENGYEDKMRERAIKRAKEFSKENSTKNDKVRKLKSGKRL